MKQLLTILALVTVVTLAVRADESTVSTNQLLTTTALTETNSDVAQGYEITLGGGGFINPKTGEKQVSLDVTFETDPFASLRSLWIGGEQSISWTPTFAGYSDIFAEWSFGVWKDKLFLNTGWDLGITYAPESEVVWNTGPHASLQYFVAADVFTYAQANYDIESKGNTDQNNVRLSFGIGWSF
jgi:hypothetical protein